MPILHVLTHFRNLHIFKKVMNSLRMINLHEIWMKERKSRNDDAKENFL